MPQDYATLKNLVAMELVNRFDLLTPVPPSPLALIPAKIQDRIATYQKSLFLTSEQLDYSVQAIAGRSIYPVPAGTQSILNIRLMLGSIWIPIRRVSYEYILAQDVINPPFRTIPSDFAQFGDTFRLYPTPDTNYPLELMCNLSPPPPAADNDINFWTMIDGTAAGTLILKAACAEICFGAIADPQRGALFAARAKEEEDSLTQRAERMAGPLFIEAYF